MRSVLVALMNGMVLVPAGSYTPFYKAEKQKAVSVAAFWLDREPVARADFASFLKKDLQWRKSVAKRIFVDRHYLEDWKSDFTFSQSARAPVTFVSWFAASAYCQSKGKALPTTDQWEYATQKGERDLAAANTRALAWYSTPNRTQLPKIGQAPANRFGVHDMLGLVWEWTQDFNEAMVADSSLFCGNGAQGATDPSDYVRFMRFAFRSSLKANFSTANLGFRCARSR